MAKEQLMMTATISSIPPGASPSAPSRVQTTDGQTLKVFAEKAAELAVGKTFQIPYYDKDYQGVTERMISKYGIIKEVPPGSGAVTPSEAPQGAPSPIPAPTPMNTPVGVANAGSSNRERSIVAQAMIKSVVAVGGDAAQVQQCIDWHDSIVAGTRLV